MRSEWQEASQLASSWLRSFPSVSPCAVRKLLWTAEAQENFEKSGKGLETFDENFTKKEGGAVPPSYADRNKIRMCFTHEKKRTENGMPGFLMSSVPRLRRRKAKRKWRKLKTRTKG